MKKIFRAFTTLAISVALIGGISLTGFAGPEKADKTEKEMAIEKARSKAKAIQAEMKKNKKIPVEKKKAQPKHKAKAPTNKKTPEKPLETGTK